MSERHDIVLSLNTKEFEANLKKAQDSLQALQAIASTLAGNIQKAFTGVKTGDLDLGKATKEVNTFNDSLKQVTNTFTTFEAKAKSTVNKVRQDLNFGAQAGKDLQRGIELGLAHSIGAISVGANPLTSLPHELIRNISISLFHTLLKTFKKTSEGAQELTENIGDTEKAVSNLSGEVPKATDFFSGLTKQAGAFGSVLSAVKPQLASFGIGVGLLLVGKVLDNLGDSFTALAQTLVKASGDASLSFTQLNATIDATGESLGRNLGSAEEWAKTIKDLSLQSGRSQKDLADFAIAFTQVGAEAGLGGEELTKLLEITAFTADRFRNSTEQLTNFRQALAGNTRFLANNIPIGNTLAEVTEKVTKNYVAQGKSQEEATAIVAKLSTAQKVLLALQEASEPIIKVAKETTGSYALEVRKLQGAIENLKISFGAGLEGVFANFTKILREVVQSANALPEPIKTIISLFIGLSGVTLDVTGKLLKLAGVVAIVAASVLALNALLATSFVGLGGTLGAYIAKFLGLKIAITDVTDLFRALKTAAAAVFTGAGVATVAKAATQLELFSAATAMSATAAATAAKKLAAAGTQFELFGGPVLTATTRGLATTGTQFELFGAEVLATTAKVAKAASADILPTTPLSKFIDVLKKLKGFSLKGLFDVSASAAITAGFNAIKTALMGLYALLPGLISRIKGLITAFGPAVAKFAAIYFLIEGFQKFAEKMELAKNAAEIFSRTISFLGSLFDPILNAFSGLNSAIPTIIKNFFSLQGAVNIVAIGFASLTGLISIFLSILFKGISVLTEFLATVLSYIPGFSKLSSVLQKISVTANDVGDAFGEAAVQTNRAIEDMIQEIEDLGKVTDAEFTKLFKALQSLNQFKGGVVALSADAVKKYKEALEKLGEELEDIKAKGKNIENGFIGELAAEATVRFNREAKELLEDRKKTAEAGLAIAQADLAAQTKTIVELTKLKNESRSKTLSIVDQNKLDAAIAKVQSLKGIIENASKISISPSLQDSELREIAAKIDAIFGEKLANKIVETQRKAFENATKQVLDLEHSFNENIKLRQESLKLEKDIEKTLNDTRLTVDDSIAKAKQQEVIKREQLKIDKEIDKVLEEIARTENLGKLDLNVPIEQLKELQGIARDGLGNLKVGIPKAELAQLIGTLEQLRGRKVDVVLAVKEDEAQKQINAFIVKTGQQIENLKEKFSEEAFVNKEQIKLAKQFNIDLGVSVAYAERRKALGEKELEVSREIKKIQTELNNKANLSPEAITALEARLAVLKSLRDDVIKSFESKQIVDANSEVNKSLKETETELKDQISLLEERAKLFEEGVLQGDFNKSKERVDFLTGALEGLLKKLIELKRQQKEEGLEVIPQETVDKVASRIEEIKKALKAANFINDIRELLQTIPDAIGEALNEGVRAVFAGTLKISELFRNMAQNILLSLSKIFANRALKGIGDQLEVLAEKIAKSDIGRKIAEMLGIDVDAAFNLGKGTPEEQLTAAVEEGNRITRFQLIPALNRLANALGIPTQIQPGKTPFPVNGKILPDLTTPLPPGQLPIGTPQEILPNTASSEVFDQFSQDFVAGFQSTIDAATPLITEDITGLGNTLTQSFNSSFTELFSTDLFDPVIDTFSSGLDGCFGTLDSGLKGCLDAVSGGLDGLLNSATSGFGSLFSSLGSLLQSGLSSLTSGIGSLFGGGGGSGFFDGILSLFGFAGGGIVGGSPSKKDNKLVPMRSGEGVLTPEATDYYGGKGFIDAANDLALPDFFSGLQAASAPAQFAGVASQATGAAPKAQSASKSSDNSRPILVTVVNKGPVVDPAHFKMKPSEVTEIFVNGMKHDGTFRRVINQNAQISKGGF